MINDITLSEDQKIAFDSVKKWLTSTVFKKYHHTKPERFILTGYAGTGKTTLISLIRKFINDYNKKYKIALVAYTGKASYELVNKLTDNNSTYEIDYVGTIHKLIYKPIFKRENNIKVIIGWKRTDIKNINKYKLIIVDESSMVSSSILKDLSSYNIPILLVGDGGQLPPIGESSNVLLHPNISLNEVHRCALDNPLIKLSMEVRENGNIPFSKFKTNGIFYENNKNIALMTWDEKARTWFKKQTQKWYMETSNNKMICLCGNNKTRVGVNILVREYLDMDKKYPYPGEKIICLKNNYGNNIYNGQIGNILLMLPRDKHTYQMTVDFNNIKTDCLVYRKTFNQEQYNNSFTFIKENVKYIYKNGIPKPYNSIDLFDYGYCITVHKSQGSEWEKVILFNQKLYNQTDDNYRRWLYTAITRAKESLIIVA